MPFKNFFTSVTAVSFFCLFSFAQGDKTGLPGSEQNETPSGFSFFSILIKEDFNLNGNTDIFSGSLIKKINSVTYWISSGSINETSNGEVITLLSFKDKIINADGQQLIDQIPAENGYIVIYKNNSNGILLVSLADKDGKGASDELQLKWNPDINKFEILNF
ncbi:MAG: hypothetical protein EHM58_11375 [Ignavibacteriae bacterium]|nr:MAG: hypothetical protein EHM58_11375 [Ignavibacteriota bacterium]